MTHDTCKMEPINNISQWKENFYATNSKNLSDMEDVEVMYKYIFIILATF